jgi:acetylornithine deacetylase/succinyl-diaminopimelate desuccinylase-like protein
MRKFSPVLAFILFQSLSAFSQTESTLKIRAYCEKNQHRIIKEFTSFLSIPNIAADTVALRKNANTIVAMMLARNIQNIQLLYPGVDSAPPAVYGEWKVPNAKSTIIFYAHYDGQPVNPAQWRQGHCPKAV